MIRILAYVILVAAAVWAAVSLVEQQGSLTLTWLGWRINTTVAFLAFCVVVFAAMTALFYRLWLALRRAPRALTESRRAARQQRGYKSLTQGMVAVAAGDPEEALRQARRADNLLGEPPMTMLLSAQAAQLNGDEAAAKTYFSKMLERPETAFLGLRGLLIQAQREGDRPTTLDLARRAYQQRPKTPWVLTTLFDLQVKEGHWREALTTLEEAMRRGVISGEVGRRHRVTVLLGCSGDAEDQGGASEAMNHARKAYNQAPEFLPAVIRLVSLMIADGKKRQASRVIHNAWARTPHPALARTYGAMESGDDAVKKVGRFERLLSFSPNHGESHIALAEAALEAKLWGTARNHLDIAGGDAPTARICRLMAELEEAETGDMTLVLQWLLRAASAEPDAAWTCTECGAAAAEWAALCAKCEALGSLEWRAPERVRGLVLRPPTASPPRPAAAPDTDDDDGGADPALPAPGPEGDAPVPPDAPRR